MRQSTRGDVVRPIARALALLAGMVSLSSLAACTDQAAVRRKGEFSWEPQSQMIWPLHGKIVSPFGDSSRGGGTGGGGGHQGVDLAARPGEPVAAALPGTVGFVGTIAGYGNVIALAHANHVNTVYAHLGDIRVRGDEKVSRGQTIALVGPEGYLHYEVRESKQAVDPEKWIALAPSPLPGGSVDVSRALPKEPASVGKLPGVLGAEANPPAAYEPQPSATAEPHTSAVAEPRPAPPPPPNPSPGEGERSGVGSASGGGWSTLGLAAALTGSNLFYVPAKLVYSGLGALTGAFALVLAHDSRVATAIWTPSVGGDYFVTRSHLDGEAPLHFFGQGATSEDTNPRATSSAETRSPSTR